jgi:DnaJ-class molecular chaperone
VTAGSTRARSRHAHGPTTDCQHCRNCPSCDGNTRTVPQQYRVVLHPGGAATAHCTRCGGTGVICHNLIGAGQ